MTRLPCSQFRKGQSRYAGPKQIIEVKGRWVFKVDDGTIWNARKLIRYRPAVIPSYEDLELEHAVIRNALNQQRPPNPAPSPLRRSQRIRRTPNRYAPQ